MCGLFGAFLNRPLGDADLRRLRDGVARLAHRGPDASGEWLDRERGVFLGHTRLRIIDLSERSAQPMVRDGAALAFNGEIYNFRELRDRMTARGVAFESEGDTEVMLRGLAIDREATLERIDGMFAAALWDGEQGWLAVDAFGEKPLYVAETEDGVWFSSELPPLVAALDAEPSIDAEMLAAYMALGFAPAPATVFPGIRRLTPATLLRVRRGRARAPQTYWRPPEPERAKGTARPLGEPDLDRIRDALAQSLERRLIADVPLCLFLSGGVDSPLVAALLRREIGRDVDAVTVGFGAEGPHDEAEAAAAIAAHLGLNHRRIEGRASPEGESVGDLLALYGQPNDNTGAFSVRALAAAARASGYTVGLTGMGGDELFFGYQKQEFLYRWRRFLALPASARRALARLLAVVPGAGSRAETFRRLIAVADHERYLAIKNVPMIETLRRLPGFDAWARSAFAGVEQPWRAAMRFDLTEGMPNSQLLAWDLGSMRASFELRTPFLSRELVETLAGFDPRAIAGFGRKSVLRRLLARYLPPELVERRKMGFVYPASRLLTEATPPWRHVDGAPEALAREAHAHRLEWDWRGLATRLAVLDRFMAQAKRPRAADPREKASAA